MKQKIDTTGFTMVEVPAGVTEIQKESKEQRSDADTKKLVEAAIKEGYTPVNEPNLKIKLDAEGYLNFRVKADHFNGLSKESLLIGGLSGVRWTDTVVINGKPHKYMYRVTVWEPLTSALSIRKADKVSNKIQVTIE